jgi:hypothetical protein
MAATTAKPSGIGLTPRNRAGKSTFQSISAVKTNDRMAFRPVGPASTMSNPEKSTMSSNSAWRR